MKMMGASSATWMSRVCQVTQKGFLAENANLNLRKPMLN